MEALRKHPADCSVAAQAAAALATMSVDASVRDAAFRLGAIEAVVAAASACLEDAEVAESACRAVANLAVDEVNQAAALECGALETARRAWRAYILHILQQLSG